MNLKPIILIILTIFISFIFIILSISLVNTSGQEPVSDVIHSRGASWDLYKTPSGQFKKIMYSGVVNMPDEEGVYQPFNEVVTMSIQGCNIVMSYGRYEIRFQPYFIMNNGNVNTCGDIPSSVNVNPWKQSYRSYHKYGVDFSNVSTNIKDNLQYVVFHKVSSSNLTWDDISKEGNSIIIKNKVKLSHDDLLVNYTLPVVNKSDIVIGNLAPNWIDNGDGTWNISFDPKVEYNFSDETDIWAREGNECDGTLNLTSLYNPFQDIQCANSNATSDSDLDSSDDNARRTYCGAGDDGSYIMFWAYVGNIDRDDLSLINWTFEGADLLSKNIADFYMYNHSNSSWIKMLDNALGSSDTTISVHNTSGDYINVSNYTHMTYIGDGSCSSGVDTDYVKLEITYTSTVTPTLNKPEDSYNTNTLSTNFNCSYTSSSNVNLSNATLYVWNSDGSINQTNLTGLNGTLDYTNLSLTFTADGTYDWNCWANNSHGENAFASFNRTFTISTDAPAINLDQPTNHYNLSSGDDVYFNFTATDSNGLDTCELYGNWTGTWHKNYTWVGSVSATMNYTTLNISEGSYIWNIWCNDTTDSKQYSSTNFTFTIDETFPNTTINSVSTTAGSQTITFNSTEQDKYDITCKYSVYNSTNEIDGINENVSYTCGVGQEHSATTTDFATYNLTIYVTDSAGNENSSTQRFVVPVASGSTSPGGGGAPVLKKEVIAIKRPEMALSLFSNLERAILYSRINDFYENQTTLFSVAPSEIDKENLLLILREQGVAFTSLPSLSIQPQEIDELDLWIMAYENNEIENVEVSNNDAEKYDLDTLTIEVIEKGFSISPLIYDTFFFVVFTDSFDYTTESNRILSSVSIIEGELGFEVNQTSTTTTKTTYKLPKFPPDFITREVKAKVNYISNEGDSTFQQINLRIINLRSPIFLVSLFIFMIGGFIFYSNKERRRSIVKLFKS